MAATQEQIAALDKALEERIQAQIAKSNAVEVGDGVLEQLRAVQATVEGTLARIKQVERARQRC
jgi:hypothetical protein